MRVPKPFWRGGDGPSSTIQSLRSINEVFLPRFGGDGEGDLDTDFGGVEGTIWGNESAADDMGDSRRFGGDLGMNFAVFFEDEEGPERDSKALIRAWSIVEGIS